VVVEVRIRGEGTDCLSLTVHRRSHPGATDYWDGNWLDCTAEVTAGGFRGNVTGCVHADELRRFRQELPPLYETLHGQVVFETAMEGWLQVRINGDGRGHFEARCLLRDYHAWDNALQFVLRFDQTYLPGLMGDLDGVLAEYPLLGRP
jgi:hypothetical protein